MASVTSLDQDMRNLRLARYTPQAANEVRTWIEETLREPLQPGDLLEALKDGVALCKLANLVLPSPGIKFKTSAMPFMQMENISHFLKACEMPPFNLPAHDRFLTVDLYESKDPAQVLQCLGAFSRQAHAINPARFKTTIGPKKSGGVVSPTNTGSNGSGWRSSTYGRPISPTKPSSAMPSATRALSPTLTGGSTGSQGSNTRSPPGAVSSWSKRADEGVTSPAWNIAQYGYMGGASQGNQGISFGARRQITSQAPHVPTLAEKEQKRKEKAAEEERLRLQAEEAEYKRRVEREAEEERERVEEQRRWEEETRRLREEERKRVEEQKRTWEEQERKWKMEEDARRKEEAEMQAILAPSFKKQPPERPQVGSGNVLRGQSLSQYQREQAAMSAARGNDASTEETPEQARVRELERQLEEAKERERRYQAEREERLRQERERSRPSTAQSSAYQAETDRPQSARESEASWAGDEREYLRQQWQHSRDGTPAKQTNSAPRQDLNTRPSQPPSLPSRPLPQPTLESHSEPENIQEGEDVDTSSPPQLPQRIPPSSSASSISQLEPQPVPTPSPFGNTNRPLPTPDKQLQTYSPESTRTPLNSNRTDAYLSTHAPPPTSKPRISASQEAGDTALEQARDRDQRLASQNKTKAGGWASKSLLEREMERERERQREWEANQQAIKAAPRDENAGSGPGQSWDIHTYGYVGGDNMNRGSGPGSGIDFGGRRQIIGPRAMGEKR